MNIKEHFSLNQIRYGWLLLLTMMISANGLAQKVESVHRPKWVQRVNTNKNFKKVLKMVSQTPPKDETINEKSETPYLAYDGKIVRKILVRHIGFEKSVIDTTRNLANYITKTADRLHYNTKEFVIRNNLFIKEGKPLNPYRVADNERTLRNLNYMKDARIYVKPIANNPDSVDLLVVTRDVFSLGGSLSPTIPSKVDASIQDINVGGRGQTFQYGQLFDTNRKPKTGYKFFYQVNNIKGSFIDASAGYTNLNDGVSVGNENESSLYLRLNRTLYQPFARYAGGAEVSLNTSHNVYKKPDSLFAQYKYVIQDYWLGYSFGHKRLPNDLHENRNRTFVAFRAFDQYFLSKKNTTLTEPDRFVYRNREALLAQLTFFRQDFYKTQYVIGFGRTEDIPYGYRLSFTAGWERELELKRPYMASELYYNMVLPSGSIYTYTLKLATYMNNKQPQDEYFSFDFSRYSKVYLMGKMKVRHQFGMGYAALGNPTIKRGIDIRDINGILGFLPDSLVGYHRLTMTQEATVFTPWNVIGFRIAPVTRIDLAFIDRYSGLLRSRNFYSGFSAGLRARNENLVFNTIEARLFYYPNVVEKIEHLRFTVAVNFRIKYPTNLVNKPATVFP